MQDRSDRYLDTYNGGDCRFFKSQMRMSLNMCKAYQGKRRYRAVWQGRVADYRETLIDQMRRRQGWTLAERIAGKQD